MRFCVRVPVLSTHRTVVAPSISTAGTRRVSTWRFEMRHAPSPRKTVSTTGSSSGRIAMASVMPTSNPLSQSPRVAPYATATIERKRQAYPAMRLTTVAVSRWVRVGSSSSAVSALPDASDLGPPARRQHARESLSPERPAFPKRRRANPRRPGAPSPRWPWRRRLAHRDGLAGKQRLVHRQVGAQTLRPHPAGTRSPSAEDDRVAAHDLAARNALLLGLHESPEPAGWTGRASASSARSVLRSWYSVRAMTTNTKPSSIDASRASPSSR